MLHAGKVYSQTFQQVLYFIKASLWQSFHTMYENIFVQCVLFSNKGSGYVCKDVFACFLAQTLAHAASYMACLQTSLYFAQFLFPKKELKAANCSTSRLTLPDWSFWVSVVAFVRPACTFWWCHIPPLS